MFTRKSKYSIVGERSACITGSLLDIGARDRKIEQYIDTNMLRYFSADINNSPDIDVFMDLEESIDCRDGEFDIVVALDVLEHVDRIHKAFSELIRITKRKLFVSLPNMSCLSFRINFMMSGCISGKYSLLPEYQRDRHRWLTSYKQALDFVKHNAEVYGCRVIVYDIITGYGKTHESISHLPIPASLRAYTILFEVSKPESEQF